MYFYKINLFKAIDTLYFYASVHSAAITDFKNLVLLITVVLVILQTNRLIFIIFQNYKVFTESAVKFKNLCRKLISIMLNSNFQ